MTDTFLILTLFFPRITLLFYYVSGWIPANPVPFWGDAVLAFFVPRVLILLYIYNTLGIESGWFWVHAVVLILAYAGGGTAASKSNDG